MSKTIFKLDTREVRSQILQADYMKSYIEQEALKRAGTDSHVKSFVGFDRAKSIIYPNTKENKGW